MKIGIYDSGIGGLSVLHRALKKMPEAEFIVLCGYKACSIRRKDEGTDQRICRRGSEFPDCEGG
ncbi:MAG: hypothetical protein ACLR2O_07750 [Coprococcus sp.]